MASKKSRKSLPATTHQSESDGESAKSSQSPGSAMKAAQDILDKTQAERDRKREDIEVDYETAVVDSGARIDSAFEAKQSNVANSRALLWDRLECLNNRREHVERQIINSMTTLETTSLNISRELIAALDGRMDELMRLGTAMDTTA